MTSKERLFARLAGLTVDRVPNLNIVMMFAARHAKVPYGKFCRDYRALVAAQTKTAIDFGIDILSTMSDPYREVHDYGAPIRFQEDNLPVCEKLLIQSPDDLPNLKNFDPKADGGRIANNVHAIETLKSENGDEFAVLGWVEGPWAEFTDLASVEEGMMMQFDEPEFVQEAMELITDKAIECAIAQIEAGADIIGVGDAAASLVNADAYSEWILPLEKKIFQAIHSHGAKVKFHVCGNINHLLPHMVNSGADIIDADYMVDYEEALRLAEGKCSISGNLDPVGLIMQGTPEMIREKTISLAKHPGKTSIISSGCEIPRDTPPENVMAIHEALKSCAGGC